MGASSSYEKLEKVVKDLKNNNYKAESNTFYNEELRVNASGNVYIVENNSGKEKVSTEQIVKLINARR